MKNRAVALAILALLFAPQVHAVDIGDAEQRGVVYVVPCYPTGTPGECAAASSDTPPPSTTTTVQGTDGSTSRVFLTDASGRLYVNINGTPAVTVSSGAVNAAAYQGGSAVSSSNPLYVQISATGAAVFPEFDGSKVLVPVFADVNTGTETSAFTTGCSGACRRVTVCNLGTSGTGCVKLNSNWTTGYPIFPRGSTGNPSCLSFYNVTYIAGGTNETSLCTGATVSFGVYPEDD